MNYKLFFVMLSMSIAMMYGASKCSSSADRRRLRLKDLQLSRKFDRKTQELQSMQEGEALLDQEIQKIRLKEIALDSKSLRNSMIDYSVSTARNNGLFINGVIAALSVSAKREDSHKLELETLINEHCQVIEKLYSLQGRIAEINEEIDSVLNSHQGKDISAIFHTTIDRLHVEFQKIKGEYNFCSKVSGILNWNLHALAVRVSLT